MLARSKESNCTRKTDSERNVHANVNSGRAQSCAEDHDRACNRCRHFTAISVGGQGVTGRAKESAEEVDGENGGFERGRVRQDIQLEMFDERSLGLRSAFV